MPHECFYQNIHEPATRIRELANICKDRKDCESMTALFEYLLTVPDFVVAHKGFRLMAVFKAREFRGYNSPALAAVCNRIIVAYRSRG